MDPVAKALWYVETHAAWDISLDEIAAASGVSRFYLSRAFAATIGQPVIAYARGRRLSEAARALAAGAEDILKVALDAGYGSHEAFTRAFREHFGETPEQVRARADVSKLKLTAPLRLDPIELATLEEPRFETGKVLLLAGFQERFAHNAIQGIPALWGRFGPHIGVVPGQVGSDTFGVVANTDDAGNFDYLAAVEVTAFSDLAVEFTRLRIAQHTYAIFTHREHISKIRATFAAIWRLWLPKSGHEPEDAPVIERYTPSFNPNTGLGGVEIWIPLKR